MRCLQCRRRSETFATVSSAIRAEIGQARKIRRRLRPSLGYAAVMAGILAMLSLAVWAYTSFSWYSYETSPAATISASELEAAKKNKNKERSGPRSHAQKPSRTSVD